MDEKVAHSEVAANPAGLEAKGTDRDVTSVIFQVIALGVLIVTVMWILRPFLISITWAGMIVVTTWPIFLRLETVLGKRRGLAVAMITLALLLAVVVPLSLAIGAIVQSSDDIYGWLRSLATVTLPPPPEWLKAVPMVGQKLSDLWQQYAAVGITGLGKYLEPYATKAAAWFLSKAGTIGMMVVQFFITVVIAAVFYANGENFATYILAFARRLAGKHGEAAVILAGRAVRSVALGVVVTAAVQATVAGLGLVITGIPAAILLTGVIFVFCLAQIGPALVLIPCIIWTYWEHGILWGTILLVFSLLAVTLDNFIRPVLIKKGADLPLVLILAGVIGGLIAFGVIGLFIGPVVLAVAKTLFDVWVSNGNAEGTPAVEEGQGNAP